MREDIATERDALNRIRLERNLSVRELAEQIDLTEANVRRLLAASRVVVNDRTAYRIREFLKRQKRSGRAA